MRIDDIGPPVSVEVVCDGSVPLDVRFDGYEGPISWAPKYWRTGDFHRSLLEIGVNPTSGAICTIVLVCLDRFQDAIAANCEPGGATGVPRTSLAQWSDAQWKIDVDQDIVGAVVDRELTLLFGEAEPAPLKTIACGRILFFLDERRDLRGFRIRDLSPAEIENWQLATHPTSEPQPDRVERNPAAKAVFEIDGHDFATLAEFYDVVSRVLIPDASWGNNLDAFHDILSGGFGTPDGGFVLRWVNSDASRERLGYPETVRQLERRLRRCHPANRQAVGEELEQARQGVGPTVFDWLVEIIEVHGAGGDAQDSGVKLVFV